MVSTKLTTADELMAMGGDEQYELIEGALIAVSPSSMESSMVTSHLGAIIDHYVFRNRSGMMSSAEGGYFLNRDPDTIVAPDIGFVAKARIPIGFDAQKYMPVPPDLAVEVISPSNSPADIFRKLALYAEAQVPLVWVVYPVQRAITVHQQGLPAITLNATDTLNGGTILSGFSIQVSEVFERSWDE